MALIFRETGKNLKNRFFEAIHGNNLVYNVCWEDPRLDRELFDLTPASRIAMITSAGCNALDYLLDNPAEIHCIDMNPRQNALLELKIRLIEHGSFDDLYAFFGNGAHPQWKEIYKDQLRKTLSPSAKTFWDKKIDYFEPKKSGKTFLYRGTSGGLAWLAHQYLRRHKKLRTLIDRLFEAESIAEQEAYYDAIEPQLWNRLVAWVMDQQVTMTLLGVPDAQKRLIDEKYPGGMGQYLKDGFRNVFTRIPIHDNYFWYGYYYGHYEKECAPEYLKKKNFEILKDRVKRISLHTTTYGDFLKRQTVPVSHFVLLDHQDWMAQHAPEALVMEWTQILEHAAPGARFVMRSASTNIDFLPFFVHERINFEHDRSTAINQRCRVGTYASTLSGIIS